jgi:hypothetical protein
MQQAGIQGRSPSPVPQARYAYYRRCQTLRKNGEQCKAPAERGTQICHAHAGQQAMALRRERERNAVLAIAVAEMRKRSRVKYEAKELFMNFDGIQVMLAVMAQALIDGRIDCKTAGRMAWQIQMATRLLRLYSRARKSRITLKRMDTDQVIGILDHQYCPSAQSSWTRAA